MANNKQPSGPYGQTIGTIAQIGNPSAPITMYSGVVLVAHPANAAGTVIYIGNANTVTTLGTVGTMGVPLGPGQAIDVPLCNLPNGFDTDLWAIGSTTGLLLTIYPH